MGGTAGGGGIFVGGTAGGGGIFVGGTAGGGGIGTAGGGGAGAILTRTASPTWVFPVLSIEIPAINNVASVAIPIKSLDVVTVAPTCS